MIACTEHGGALCRYMLYENGIVTTMSSCVCREVEKRKRGRESEEELVAQRELVVFVPSLKKKRIV